MKRKTSCFLIIFLITALLSNVVAFAAPEDNAEAVAASDQVNADTSAERLKEMELVAENDYLELYVDMTDTDVAVREKATGYVWFTNLADRENIEDEAKRIAAGAHISIEYFDSIGTRLLQDTLQNAVEPGFFEIKKIDNGIRIEYTLKNKVEVGVGTRARIYNYKGSNRYQDVDIIEDAGDSWGYMEYQTTDMNVYYIKKDELYKNMQNQIFFIPLEYRIEENSLVVTIPCGEVTHPKDYPLTNITVLPYFGAAHYTSDGYMLVPDGSGALVNIRKVQAGGSISYKQLYGPDPANLGNELLVWQEPGIMPVFGMKNGDNAFLAVIEDGEAFASITSNLANFNSDYCTIYGIYNVMPTGTITLAGAASPVTAAVYQSRIYKGDIRTRYYFLHGKDANYVGMAKVYRNYLVKKYGLEKIEAKENIPLNLELLGAIRKAKSVLGFPVKLPVPLTTFKQAEQIVDELLDNGINNLKVKYTGWFNGGINHSIPTKIKPDRVLGGKRGFKKLIEFMEEKGVGLYPDVALHRVYKAGIFNFNKSRDTVKSLSQRISKVFPYSFVDYTRDFSGPSYWVLNPRSLERIVGKFVKAYNKYGLNTVSLRDLGTDVTSDFDKDDVIDRQQGRYYAEEQIKKLHDMGYDMMMTKANMYAVPYASTVLNAPVDDSHFNLTDETIPFFQIALHGYIDYTGEPINLAQDYEMTILRSIETGASPYYKLMYEDCSIVKNTDFVEFYSANYFDWKDDLLNVYNKLNEVLRDVQDKEIVDHRKLDKNVYMTTYENNKSIIVNYGDKEVEVLGVKVGGKSYVVLEGVDAE